MFILRQKVATHALNHTSMVVSDTAAASDCLHVQEDGVCDAVLVGSQT